MAKDKEKIPLNEIKRMPYKTLNRLILKAKNKLLNDQVWQNICKEYDEDPNIIDLIPTMFGNLDVSAKTDHGIVILNYRLLCDGDFTKDISYMIHEYSHWLQQTKGDKPTKGSDDGNYLKNPFEQEAFSNQVEYIAKDQGKEEAEQYVEDLLEYHDVNDKDYEDLEDVLMEKI